MEPLWWGTAHYQQEHKLLVAGDSSGLESGAVPVSLVIAAVPVQYRVKDLYSFLYNYGVWKDSDGQVVYEAHERLKGICYSQLTEFAASTRIEVGQDGQANSSLLGAGRAQAKEVLTKNIQAEADKARLGVEIVFVGLQGIHPPPEVAPNYQAVIGAVQMKQALVLQAQAEKNKSLSTLVGSVARADKLAELAAQYQEARKQGRDEDVRRLGEQFETAFAEARGEIFRILSEAQSYKFAKATLAKATGERFAGQVQAYRAAPDIYMCEQRSAALENGLMNIRKYVVASDSNDREVIVLDLQDKLPTNLLDIGGLEESRKQ
jgi:regulator of protease activity HflC (stomatin/prohibitin superfamily)